MDRNSTDFKIHIPHEMFEPGGLKHYSGDFNIDEIASNVDTFSLKSPIGYDLTLTNTGDAFLLSGSVKAQATTLCSRCLEECGVELEGTVDAYYLLQAPDDERDAEINEFEILPEDHQIDVGKLICASMIVDAPLKPLCDPDCKGLCAKCGANLNREECMCSDEPDIDSSPFAVLRDFKVED